MIKPAALILAVTMTAVSAGTYYGLNLLPPGTIPEPIGRAVVKAEPPKPGAAKEQEVASAAPVAPAPAEPAPAEQPMTEEDLAEEPPPEPQAAAPEPEPATTTQAEAPAPEPTPQPAPAQPRQQPPALVDEPAPAPQQQPPPAAPKKKVTIVRGDESEPTETASAERPTKPKPPEADVITPWWPDSTQIPAGQLKLQYAGQVQGEQAIALLFSAALNLETVKQHAQIKTASGEDVPGQWELGKNPRLAVFRGVRSGRYTVILTPRIADTKGFMLGQTLQGPVYVQPPEPQ